MKKKLTCLMAMLFCVAAFTAFGGDKKQVPVKSEAAPVRLTVWPGAWYFPKGWPIYGLSLGLPATSGTNEQVCGADLAILFASTNNVKGCQSAIVNKGNDLIGAQIGIVSLSNNLNGGQVAIYNSADKFDGAQAGIVNNAKKGDGFQLGIVNIVKEADGFQIGLLNIMDNGFFKVFPFFNYSVSKDKK